MVFAKRDERVLIGRTSKYRIAAASLSAKLQTKDKSTKFGGMLNGLPHIAIHQIRECTGVVSSSACLG